MLLALLTEERKVARELFSDEFVRDLRSSLAALYLLYYTAGQRVGGGARCAAPDVLLALLTSLLALLTLLTTAVRTRNARRSMY